VSKEELHLMNTWEAWRRGMVPLDVALSALHRATTRMASASNTLRLTAEAVLARGDTVEVGRG
jgi:hypothetical protein